LRLRHTRLHAKTLKCKPRRCKIIEYVREEILAPSREPISERPAPLHPIPVFGGPSLLAMGTGVSELLLHLPLNRTSGGVERDVSTLAEGIGATVVASPDHSGRPRPCSECGAHSANAHGRRV
jgi:hypothetical protein